VQGIKNDFTVQVSVSGVCVGKCNQEMQRDVCVLGGGEMGVQQGSGWEYRGAQRGFGRTCGCGEGVAVSRTQVDVGYGMRKRGSDVRWLQCLKWLLTCADPCACCFLRCCSGVAEQVWLQGWGICNTICESFTTCCCCCYCCCCRCPHAGV
jgi:hypothetical protein